MTDVASQRKVTPELVAKAYQALGSGDREKCSQYWDEGMVWLVPGHNQLSGRYEGLDEFLGFMARVGQLSERSFQMKTVAVMTGDDYSADVTRNLGHRAGNADKKLDINVIHLL